MWCVAVLKRGKDYLQIRQQTVSVSSNIIFNLCFVHGMRITLKQCLPRVHYTFYSTKFLRYEFKTFIAETFLWRKKFGCMSTS